LKLEFGPSADSDTPTPFCPHGLVWKAENAQGPPGLLACRPYNPIPQYRLQ
jgi:hypothetical protein